MKKRQSTQKPGPVASAGPADENLLTTTQAAERLGVSAQTIRNRIRDGKLRGWKRSDNESGEERYWVPEAEIENEEPAAESEDIVRRYTEETIKILTDRMNELQKEQAQKFDAILKNQEQGLDMAKNMVGPNQDKMIALLTQITEQLANTSRHHEFLITLLTKKYGELTMT
jgi:excisionase family DNA binding protein